MSSHTPSAILAVSSLDRYTKGNNKDVSRINTGLINLYSGVGQPGNNFELVSSGAFIYGYITRIAVSQIQIDYRVPTVVPSNSVWPLGANNPTVPKFSGNDTFPIYVVDNPPTQRFQLISIPYGFYTPQELATILTIEIQTYRGLEGMTVTYTEANLSPPGFAAGLVGGGNGFIFQQAADASEFRFPTTTELTTLYTLPQITSILKTYRMLGVEQDSNILHLPTAFYLTQAPNFLYTSYVDIVSSNLTKFQKVKDSDTSVYGRAGLVSRLYLSGVGYPQQTSLTYALGSQPFIATTDLNTPKVIRWNKDETVYNLDFQMYDQYGDLLFWNPNFPTEFQMTLLCQEEDD